MDLSFRPDLASRPERLSDIQEFSLDRQDTESIRYLIWSDAWIKFFQPFLESMERGLTNKILDPSWDRKSQKNDDYLRGAIHAIRALVNFPHQVVAETDAAVAEEQRAQQEAQVYELRGRVGNSYPMGTTPGE